MSSKRHATNLDRLDSWKSIGQYLGKTSRTVQRWHVEYGLPIQHIGGPKSPVFAYIKDLEGWMRDRDRLSTESELELPGPVLLQSPSQGTESDFTIETDLPGSSLVSGLARARSEELVDLAAKLWESLSQRSQRSLVVLLREAIDLDPTNAVGFADLSIALIVGGMLGYLRPRFAYISAKAANQRALEIDSELVEAKYAAGLLKMVLARDWFGARLALGACRSEYLDRVPSLIVRALLHIAEGGLEESRELLLAAIERFPLSSTLVAVYCWTLYLAGEFGESLSQIEQARAAGSSGPVLDAVEALTSMQVEERHVCRVRVELMHMASPQNELVKGALGWVYALTGEAEKATELLHSMTRHGANRDINEPYGAALVLIGLNEREKAVEQLESSYRQGSIWSLGFRHDWVVEPLRNDPHYLHFLSRARYPSVKGPNLGLVSGR